MDKSLGTARFQVVPVIVSVPVAVVIEPAGNIRFRFEPGFLGKERRIMFDQRPIGVVTRGIRRKVDGFRLLA